MSDVKTVQPRYDPPPPPPAPVVPVAREIILAMASTNQASEQISRALEVCDRRKRELTVTSMLLEGDRRAHRLMSWALTGFRFDSNAESEIRKARPVHQSIKLASTKRGAAGFEDIIYKTDSKELNIKEMHTLRSLGGRVDNTVRCKVDPTTGEFLEAVDPVEAIKILRQYGEGISRPRHRQWVRELAHHEQYVAGRPAFAVDEAVTT